MSNSGEVAGGERAKLMEIQRGFLRYFLENQTEDGLILDRQSNYGPPRPLTEGWCSTAATGMGLVALSLACREPYQLISTSESIERVGRSLQTAIEKLPEDHGMMPHFCETGTHVARGRDMVSTVDSSWLIGGALWAAAFLKDAELETLAARLYDRVDWAYWTHGHEFCLINHGKNRHGRFFRSSWDRINGETIMMYVLGVGAKKGVSLPTACWSNLKTCDGIVAGLRFNNADLGLFAFGYGMELLDLTNWLPPNGVDLAAEARTAILANHRFCRAHADQFSTYRQFWGLSDGDGPGNRSGRHPYRAYGPGFPLDGTAHINSTIAAVASRPAEVLENLARADHSPGPALRGRQGYASVNLDREWVGTDVVGIDAGAVVMALDNFLMDNRVRRCFHELPCVVEGIARAGFTRR